MVPFFSTPKLLTLLIPLGFIIFTLGYPEYAKRYSMLLTLNSPNEYQLPRNFRITPYNTSASGQYSQKEFERMLHELPSSVSLYIVDLRKEEHGFLNGMAVSWYTEHNWGNIGKPLHEILDNEKNLLQSLSSKWWTVVYHDRFYPVPYRVGYTQTEQALVQQQAQAHYLRLPLTDHRQPEDHEVDAFISFYKQLPENAWLHFHCSAGRGRSTTLLTLHDIMLNAPSSTLEEIIKRQTDLGGVDLIHISDNPVKEWKRPHAEQRGNFIRQFYQYAKEEPGYTVSWSEWLRAIEKK